MQRRTVGRAPPRTSIPAAERVTIRTSGSSGVPSSTSSAGAAESWPSTCRSWTTAEARTVSGTPSAGAIRTEPGDPPGRAGSPRAARPGSPGRCRERPSGRRPSPAASRAAASDAYSPVRRRHREVPVCVTWTVPCAMALSCPHLVVRGSCEAVLIPRRRGIRPLPDSLSRRCGSARPVHRSVRGRGRPTAAGGPSAAGARLAPVGPRLVPGAVPARVAPAHELPQDQPTSALHASRRQHGRAESRQNGVRGGGGVVQRAAYGVAVTVGPEPEAGTRVRRCEPVATTPCRGCRRGPPVGQDAACGRRAPWSSRGRCARGPAPSVLTTVAATGVAVGPLVPHGTLQGAVGRDTRRPSRPGVPRGRRSGG